MSTPDSAPGTNRPDGGLFAHTWVVDAANVIGSRPDGWWRDRSGAANRLLSDILTLLTQPGERSTPERGPSRVLLVLEGSARSGVPAGWHTRRVPDHTDMTDYSDSEFAQNIRYHGKPNAGAAELYVIHAPGSGDDAVVAAAAAAEPPVLAISSDRALRDRLEALGVATVGAGWLRDRIDRARAAGGGRPR